jgi:hypothetical protein
MRHSPLQEPTDRLNQRLRGHYAYYGKPSGLAEGPSALWSITGAKCRAAGVGKTRSGGRKLLPIKERFPLLQPKLRLPYGCCKLSPLRCESTSDERSAGNLHATFCGSGEGRPPRPPGRHWTTGVPTATGERGSSGDRAVE